MSDPSMETDVALLKERVKVLQHSVAELERELEGFKTAANRWKGGFVAAAALGSFIGWLATVWDKIMRALH